MSYTTFGTPDVHQLPQWDLPTGALAQTFSRTFSALTNTTSGLATQNEQFNSIYLPTGLVVTSSTLAFGGTPATNPTNWWYCLRDASNTIIRQSTDQLTTAISANTRPTLALDSVPTTAGARVASTTVTLTVPTLKEALTSLVAVGDSVAVSNANIVAYNGTFTVTAVTATTIAYVSGGSATDSLAAPFPTVQLASGKRTYAVVASGAFYLDLMVKAGTVPSTLANTGNATANAYAPLIAGRDSTNTLTGTAVAGPTVGGNANHAWGYVS